MTVWHGDKNISHNAGEILSKYDHVSRKYVVDVAGKLATEFKKVADYYGYKQVSPDETPEQAPADKGK